MRDTIATAATLAAQPNVAAPHDVIDGAGARHRERERGSGGAGRRRCGRACTTWRSGCRCCSTAARRRGGKRLLSPKHTFARAVHAADDRRRTRCIRPTRLAKPHWMTYGLGWFQQDYRGRAVDFHTGSIDGMVAIHGLIRDERLGVYVLGNLDHAELRHALMYTVFDRYVGGAGPRLERGAAASCMTGCRRGGRRRARKNEAQRVAGTTPSLPLAAATRAPTSIRSTATCDVTHEGGGLRLQLRRARLSARSSTGTTTRSARRGRRRGARPSW